MNKFLLTTLNAKYIHTNLAIRLLYQLNKKHEGLYWKEFTIKDNFNEVASYCSSFEVIAFSCYIWNITQTLEVAQLIKQINPNTKILLGGPEVSYDWEAIIKNSDIDYIIAGEGEIAFRQFLLEFPQVENVQGIIFKKDGRIITNSAPPVFNLQELNEINPYEDDNLTELKSKVLYVETSRGCPYKCEFCLASLDNKVRYLSFDRIKEILFFLMQYGKTIKFLDRTFNIKKDFTIAVFDYIIQHYKSNTVFQFEITADILHQDIINYIDKKAPKDLFRFEIGIQSVNSETNLEVSRKQNFDKTKKIIQSIAHKIELHLDLIVGLPFEDFDKTKKGFEEVFKLFAPELQLGFLKFLKGTPMRDKILKHGYEFDENPPYQIIKSKYLNESELQDILLLEHALEIYWNKKRSVHVLKYVSLNHSIFDVLLDLGKIFKEQNKLYKHTLEDVYINMHNYISKQFPYNEILLQLHNIDYALYNKIRPGNHYGLLKHIYDEKQLMNLTSEFHKNKKVKYSTIDILFDYELWKNDTEISNKKSKLLIAYNSLEKPVLTIV
jgi:radical SAM superfamily enzyme YgiQ (UPF0313 family)